MSQLHGGATSSSGKHRTHSSFSGSRHAWVTGIAVLTLVGLVTGCGNSSANNASPNPTTVTNQAQTTTGTDNTANTPSTNTTTTSTDSGMKVINQTPHPMKVVRNGNQVSIDMYTEDTTVQVNSGAEFHAWTFDGTVPGPVIELQQGDKVTLTLHNLDPTMSHSIDLHAAQVAPNEAFTDVAPGETKTMTFDASLPGVFMYHCETAPMALHIAQGMYGAVVVTPKGQEPPKYVIVQGEIYKENDMKSVLTGRPDYVVFNGAASQYVEHPLAAKVGQPLTVAFVNAGPNEFSAFHVVGTVLRDVQASGNPANHLVDVQTYTVAPGDGALIHLQFDKPGLYAFVTHSMADMTAGAIGKFDVSN